MIRKSFVYLSVLALVLGVVGALIIARDFSGMAVLNPGEGKERYSAKEVGVHNDEKSCWISYKNKVYDITLFLQVYPDKRLRKECGKILDNIDFLKYEESLKEYEIGVLA